ncbi:mannitol dehydrogenase [Sinorhizobium fredii]|uniref:Mannitol dehydrogenase n=1 Tax=Rhizobium fredii TaxID=380 RepID=A0A2A6M7P2_RHIFR|nr:mannitol dehydrogenase family protein [Sinorhizobium fredii]PDT50532.1 mannitol dehydrogenase [Sinorhizobium fredii]
MTTKLSLATLDEVANSASVPAYDRSGLKAGIVHFGVGNFHRAHQAVYLDDLFNLGIEHDWAIVGAGVLPSDEAMRTKLRGQDFLTTVVEQDNNRSGARVTGAMIDYLKPGDVSAIVGKLADPAIRIVSLTITEGGYFIDPASGIFDPTHPAISSDAANPADPKTVFGLIVAGLTTRRQRHIEPFTVMSCDNIPGNGEVTHAAVAGLARLFDSALADWIDAHVAFPNGMVDRITPATGPREIGIVADEYGIEDAWPVFCEEFKQWVLEDHFPLGRPALEKVGVRFVPDVAPYEHMKIRMLNGGHAAIAYPAALLDIHFVHEAMEEPLIRGFLAKLERDEIIPVIPPVPGTDLKDYYKLIETRFSNPKIGDTIPRLAQDGSNRQPKFILPSTADRLARGEDVVGLALVSALWCHYLAGTTDSGKTISFNDPNIDRIRAAASKAKSDPYVFLELRDIFGAVAISELFRKRFAKALQSLQKKGTRATLQSYLDGRFGD